MIDIRLRFPLQNIITLVTLPTKVCVCASRVMHLVAYIPRPVGLHIVMLYHTSQIMCFDFIFAKFNRELVFLHLFFVTRQIYWFAKLKSTIFEYFTEIKHCQKVAKFISVRQPASPYKMKTSANFYCSICSRTLRDQPPLATALDAPESIRCIVFQEAPTFDVCPP